MNKKFEFVLALSSVHSKISKSIDKKLSMHGISFSEYLVMQQLSLASQHSMRRIDLAENIGMSASGMTRLLNPLEKMGITQKEPNPRDARVSMVKLTQTGLELFQDATASVLESTEDILGAIDNKSIEKFLETAKKIR